MNRFNQYLLTHHPLLWNTRVAWVLLTNLILHLLFLLSGFGAVSASTVANHSRYESIGGSGMYTMSVLCGLVVLIVWCIYYLRNNAFKSFYRIGKWYLAKEFAIIFLIILSSITYFRSFEQGVHVRIHTITSEAELVNEINIVNKAAVYIPVNKEDYFVLNNCAEKRKANSNEAQIVDHHDTVSSSYYSDSVRIKQALQRPDAYSYVHYCNVFLDRAYYVEDHDRVKAEAISAINKRWLTGAKKDSVKNSLVLLFSILNKYGITYSLNTDELVNNVFNDTFHTIKNVVATEQTSFINGMQIDNQYFFPGSDIINAIDLIEDVYSDEHDASRAVTTWNVVGYLALSLSILLLCYRRFSRRVFLISVVGTLIWTILIGLTTLSMGSITGFASLLLFLFVSFLAGSIFILRSKGSKTPAGVLLSWQGYLAPYVVMLVVVMLNDYHDKLHYNYDTYNSEEWVAQHYPFATWVHNHTGEIFLVNIFIVALYIALVVNRLVKKWQTLPEE